MTIREISVDDAESAAQLSGELGYAVTPDVMRQRLKDLQGRSDRAIFAAEVARSIVAWIDVCVAGHLQSGSYGEIGGFIVSEKYRSSGIGKQLLAHAEKWMQARGLKRSLVRSQVAREAAHRFYLRENYSRVKTSAVFEKDLA